jgi:GTP-binding protein LepA
MNYRNFVIISHVDHGKSTLADRFLEATKSVDSGRGITIKLQPVRMRFDYKGKEYVLNLVDTPGHVDFSYEVSRSLAAVEGAVLLVDASKGIQAQTLANLELARKQELEIIPAVNKIDLPQAMVEETVLELANLLGIDPDQVLQISAKDGINIEKVLERVIEKVPPPEAGRENKDFRALVFDSDYNSFQGVVAYIRVKDGKILKGEKIRLLASKSQAEAKDVGCFSPALVSREGLSAGEVGYIATGIKEPGLVRVGDTISKKEVDPLPGYKEPKPMVFASLYPEDPDKFEILKEGLSRLKLSDPSLFFELERKDALGRGFRCGFLGNLHAEIVSERISREFDVSLVISSPSVAYKIEEEGGPEKEIYSASDWPDPSRIRKIKEPWILMEVITPLEFMSQISDLLKNREAVYADTKDLGEGRVILIYEAPLRAIITNFYNDLKNVSKGFASLNYKVRDYREADLVKMDILVAGEKEEALSRVVPRKDAFKKGKALVEKLKEKFPPQQFSVALQAAVGGKIIARETLKARRKDVTASLYGGDFSRKRKLLEKQKKGKKKLKEKGGVSIPPQVFLEMFRE